MLFNILVHKTDDNLRNHGFLIGRLGIRPESDPESHHLSLSINEAETACEVENALDADSELGLNGKQADSTLAAG